MIVSMALLELRSVDPARNRYRIYRLREVRTLFGEVGLVVEWGRIGRPLRVREELFRDAEALERRRAELLGRRRRSGYVVAEWKGASSGAGSLQLASRSAAA